MKKRIKISLLVLCALFVSGAGYILIKSSYNGNEQVILLNSGMPYTSFKDILQRPEFKNKVVYVDVWGTSCLPCFDELKNYTPLLTNRYKDKKDIAFLYICIDRHPLPEIRWKSKIQMFKPKGYHVLVEEHEEARLATDILGQTSRGGYFPYIPYYLIVDKQGHIVSKTSPNPDEGEIRPSGNIALYHKLDSLRSL